MQRILFLAWKDIYLTYTDRSTLLYMFATPLLISSIIGLVFGGLSGGQLTFEDIPVAIVNDDAGTTLNDQTFNYGDTLVGILMPSVNSDEDAITEQSCDLPGVTVNTTEDQQDTSLDDLLNVTQLDDYEAARAGVQNGTYAAAIYLPPDFSSSMTPDIGSSAPEDMGELVEQTQVQIYGNSAQNISVSIVRGVIESIINQFVTGNATIAATTSTLIDRASNNLVFGAAFLLASATGDFNPNYACAFQSGLNTISIEQQPLDATQEQSDFVQVLLMVGSAQAVFFALFTGYIGLNTIYEERKGWTLQRLIMAPMPRSYVLIGKLLGNSLNVLLQILILLIALTVIASLVEGQLLWIWGSNILLIAVLLVVLTLSVSGIGVLIVGAARTREQTFVIAPIINVAFGALGGAFGFTLSETFAQFSPVYWGTTAFGTLAGGSTDIGLNLLVLTVQGLITFAIGAYLFSRRINV